MKTKTCHFIITIILFFISINVFAAQMNTNRDAVIKSTAIKSNGTSTKNSLEEVYLLSYNEREAGTDNYEVVMYVTPQYIRIDEVGREQTGYILYDDKKKIIYSVTHEDESIFLIKNKKNTNLKIPVVEQILYKKVKDAPKISNHEVFHYQVFEKKHPKKSCIDIQLAENLLPEVTKILQRYQQLISLQQLVLSDNKLDQNHDACFYISQIYDNGKYYKKGLPIQEKFSNGKFKLLTNYKKIKVDKKLFTIPKNYRQFSINGKSKISLD